MSSSWEYTILPLGAPIDVGSLVGVFGRFIAASVGALVGSSAGASPGGVVDASMPRVAFPVGCPKDPQAMSKAEANNKVKKYAGGFTTDFLSEQYVID